MPKPSAQALGILDVVSVLQDQYGLDGVVRRRNFQMLCPSHEDTRPSCDVDIETGYWNCWSCDAGGDIVDLGKVVLGKPRSVIRKMLRISDPDLRAVGMKRRLEALRASVRPEKARRGSWYPSIPPAGSYAPEPMDYMTGRGFTLDTCERWGVRYASRVVLEKDPDTIGEDENKMFELVHVIAIPVIGSDDNVAMWTYRSTPKSEEWMRKGAKYIHTPGVDKQRLWFGHHLAAGEDEVAVCEGPLDAMWLDQCGIPAMANLGSHLKNLTANLTKIDALCSFKRVTLFFDRDAAGLASAQQIGELLHGRGVDVHVATYPSFTRGANDPAELNPIDAEIMYWKAPSFLKWCHSGRLRRRSR